MSVINTNYLALVSQTNLTKSQNSLGTAIERLSSGLRINSAKDDAAGQAIANRFTANIKGLTQAGRNANDGISIAQTTEGALNEINNNLQRIRELSVQAANGSNSASDLDSIQAEIKQRLDEIDRVSEQTQFNGVNVLAKDNSLKVQVGAHDSETITVNLKEITASTLGLSSLDMGNQVTSKSLSAAGTNYKEAATAVNVNLTYPPSAPAVTLEVVTGGTRAGELVAKTAAGDYFAATYNSGTNKVSYDTAVAGKLTAAEVTGSTAAANTTFINGGTVVELADLAGATHDNPSAALTYDLYRNDATGAFVAKDSANKTFNATVDLSTGAVTIGTNIAVDPTGTAHTKATNGNVLTIPGSALVTYNLTDVNSKHTGTNALFKSEAGDHFVRNTSTDGDISYYKATVAADGKVTTGAEVVVDPLKAIDNALQQVDSLRSDLGAVQNRFQSTIANLSNTVNNLSAARSRIEDADYAVEVSNMTRAQILQQAGTSVLAQANQVPQTVLSLLR